MEPLHNIFVATINENANNPKLPEIVGELCFELSKKKIQRLKDEKNIQKRLGELFELYIRLLDSEKVKNIQTIDAVISALVKVASHDKEEFLYKSIYEKEQLEKSIKKQKNDIKNSIIDTFTILEEHISKMEENLSIEALKALNDAQLKGVQMLGILRETTYEALLTTLEKGEDVEDTAFEIIKSITYQAINEGKFVKYRFIDVTRTIVSVAIEIADENQSYARELLKGSIKGTKEGIAKAIDKFKNDLKFAPDEIEEILENDLISVKKDLIMIEDDYITMIEEVKHNSNEISTKIINELLENELNSSLARLKRVTAEARETISEKLEELKESANDFENGFMDKAEQRFANIKEDMGRMEEKASKTLDSIKNFEFENESAKKAAAEAKKLGNRAWEVAKNVLDGAIKGAKDTINKDKE